jgi:hypothetical protein
MPAPKPASPATESARSCAATSARVLLPSCVRQASLPFAVGLPGGPSERLAGSAREVGTPFAVWPLLEHGLLDRILILGERHLTLVLREYLIHYNGHRPHQSRLQRPPNIETQPTRNVTDLRSIRRKPVVAGVISEYHRAA